MKLKRRIQFNKTRIFICLFSLLLLVAITVGYAFITTSLSIEGVGELTSSQWNVYFNNIQPIEGSISPIEEPSVIDNTTVTFSAKLDNPGDFYGFTIDIRNDGTMDAMIESIDIQPVLTAEQEKYFEYQISYTDGVEIQEKHKLSAGTKESISVAFQYLELASIESYPTDDQDFTFEITIHYVQADETSIIRPTGE